MVQVSCHRYYDQSGDTITSPFASDLGELTVAYLDSELVLVETALVRFIGAVNVRPTELG